MSLQTISTHVIANIFYPFHYKQSLHKHLYLIKNIEVDILIPN